jgi:FkbM family methyltransferase
MLIPLDYIVRKYGVRFTGILHVGAHECEELLAYDKYLDRNNMLWIEALQDKVDFCKKNYQNIKIEQAVISDCVEKVIFHRSTNGVLNNAESSSILEFGTHAVHHPHVKFIDEFTVDTKPLSEILINYNIPFNFVNLDIQGVELKALKGMESYLHSIQYIYTEVNSDYVYKNCGLVSEIDEYLEKFGFRRVETVWCGNTGWGDAFYIKT